jgi:hypothetical protein
MKFSEIQSRKNQKCKKLSARGKIKLCKERGGKGKFGCRIFENVLKRGQGRGKNRGKLYRKKVKGIF